MPMLMVGGKRCFFIQEHMDGTVYHGSIGNTDVERVFLANGIEPISFPHHNSFSLWAKVARIAHLFKLFFQLRRGAIVFFQHPLYAGMNKLLLKLLRYQKKVTIVCFITDISGLKFGNDSLLKKEIKLFQAFRYFIVHNDAMQEWLRTHVPGHRAAQIRFFDFLTEPASIQRTNTLSVAFAGNLAKSSFLEKMDVVGSKCPSLSFNLYGPHVTVAMQGFPNVTYKGVVEPYSLPQVLEGSFGLIWDGDGIERPDGSMGHYMQYITHHKTSLYILSHMPLIVYEQAGSASLVKRYHIGFTIRDLFEIEEKLKQLPAEEYRQMCDNTRMLARQIASGGCLTNALQEITAIIQQEQKS